ncbi:MAG: hypothetical protein LUG47_09895 [Clostridiales bacterium]|nr:hypothetical protein [Clostridiales bacterium]
MDATLDAGEALTGTTLSYNGSGRTIDVTNATAVAFTQALLQKYISYFADAGCTVFNIGADEYANDVYTSGSMGFGALQSAGQYSYYVQYVNQVAKLVKNAGMTPMAFNDGIYFNNVTDSGSFDADIMIAYWSSGWNGYTVASASTLAGYGFKLINTHGDYYWIVGGSQCSASTAANFSYTTFQGSTISDPAGAMFCIWSDYPGALTDTQVASQTADVIAAFGATLPSVESTVTDDTTGITATATGLTSISVVKGDTVTNEDGSVSISYTVLLNGGDYTGAATLNIPVDEALADCVSFSGVVGDDSFTVTKNGDYLVCDVPHFSTVTITGSAATVSDSNSDEVEVTNTETINISVGSSTTATISGYNFAGTYSTEDTSIATVSVTGSDAYTSDPTYSSGSTVRVGNIISSNSTSWTSTNYYYKVGDVYYPLYAMRSSSTMRYTYTWGYYNGSETVTLGEQEVYSFNTNNTYAQVDSSNLTLYTQTSAGSDVEASTTVTFTGVAVGTTYVTVGNTRYTINVTAEDLSSVTGLTVEFWITNRRVTANGGTTMTISASAAYGVNGVLISSLVPDSGTQSDTGNVAYWKTTRLTSSIKQTTTSGVDRTTSGDDFTYIRYYNGSWAFSSDGTTWTTISSTDQIVAYYLMVTDVTDEITTEVVDWGTDRDSYSASNFVLVDYAVHYENGTISPSTYPSFDTNAFHCDSGDTTTVHRDSTTGIYYREIGMIQAVNSADYEVYMITLTPTSDNASTAVATTAAQADSYTYNGTEKVVWVIDEETLATTAFADSSLWFTSISGEITLTVGGEAIVPGLEIYNQQGMLVTYYIRAKQTEDSLTVNYVDLTTNTQFYSYNIAVNSGTTFSTNPAIALDEDGNVVNGSVVNKQNVTQTVSSDLSTLAAVSALYQNSEYTCVRLELSEDGKTVTLYYTFNTTAYFVVDFGLPVTITAADIVTGATAITAVNGTGASLSGGVITWQATSVMTGIQSFSATVSETTDNGTVSHTYTVYMVPATTLYYEEGFASYGNGWDLSGNGSWSNNTNKGSATQETEIANEANNTYNNYNYDGAYADDATGSEGTAATTSTKGDTLSFTFTGTGVDIFANCDDGSGYVTIRVADSKGTVQKLLFVNLADLGTYATTTGSTAYNTPIASVSELTHGTYTVTIYLADKGTSGFAFDGFRVYGTIDESTDENTKAIYTTDNEDAPDYYELRNNVLGTLVTDYSSSTYAEDIANGVAQVYATGDTGAVVAYSSQSGLLKDGSDDLLDVGPKNELYLDSGAKVVFKITTAREVQIGLRSVTGTEVSFTINDGETQTISSSVDMFYTLQSKSDSATETTYTITVASGGILSITDIKVSDSTGENIFGALTADEVIAALTGSTAEAETADAALTVDLVDYTGSVVASTQLTDTGIEGDSVTFASGDILAAVDEALPEGYALVDEDSVADQAVTCGETGSVTVQIGKVATLTVTYQKYSGLFKKTTVGTVTLTKVQTSADSKATFSSSEIKAAAPDGCKVLVATSASVSYGSSATKTVTVY